MRKAEIRIESSEEFFARGRKLARRADKGLPIPQSRIIAFEDAATLLHILTAKRLSLLRQVKQTPASISGLAKVLGRDRSAVTRDVQLLERYGVLQVTERSLAGHGLQKWVTPIARELQLSAQL